MSGNLDKKTRIHFSESFKRKALLDFSQGIKASEILKKESNDKKYASKLIHKWRKELYQNPNMLALIYSNIDFSDCFDELKMLGEDDEYDDFIPE